jgi:hypothetical protein
LLNIRILLSATKYTEAKVNSKTSKKDCSIFEPRPSLSILGKSRCRAVQMRYVSFSLRSTFGTSRGGVK